MEERPSETGEELDSCRDCPATLCWLQVSGPELEHHFPEKQVIPSELSQENIQRRSEKLNLCRSINTLLAMQEPSHRLSSKRLLTESSLLPPTFGMPYIT